MGMDREPERMSCAEPLDNPVVNAEHQAGGAAVCMQDSDCDHTMVSAPWRRAVTAPWRQRRRR